MDEGTAVAYSPVTLLPPRIGRRVPSFDVDEVRNA